MRPSAVLVALTLALGPAPCAAANGDAARVETCFTPRERCTGVIVAAIDRARREIRVQAYGFTSMPILAALVEAHRRGVAVAAILDKSNASAKNRRSGARMISGAGVPVWIDHRRGIAHNKVIVIDGHLVITGSFNFTVSADRWNAENLVLLESPTVAANYLVNWRALQLLSRAYAGGEDAPERWRARRHGHHRRWSMSHY